MGPRWLFENINIIYVYMVNRYMKSVGVYLRVSKELLEKFSKIAEMLGMSRSEAIRKVMKMFITINEKKLMVQK